MTVSILSKHDVSKTDDNENETCCSDKNCDETESFLKNRTAMISSKSMDELLESTESEKPEAIKQEETLMRKCSKIICSFQDAPEFVKHNTFILSGYRGTLSTKQCVESLFWWTNETINIWSHVFGFVLFFATAIRDFMVFDVHTALTDRILVAFVLLCFQVCMLLSALYHTFSCRSAHDCDRFLTLDLLGIALSLYAIYISGIYFAFWCDPALLNFYILTVTVIFVIAMMLHYPRFKVSDNVKMLVFVGWAAYGVIPTFHWSVHMGWFESPIVNLLLPKVFVMYLITGTAFFIYITKIPERFCAGKFDYLGHSHQWWHMLVLGALYYWHSAGIVYLEYRLTHSCYNYPTLM